MIDGRAEIWLGSIMDDNENSKNKKKPIFEIENEAIRYYTAFNFPAILHSYGS